VLVRFARVVNVITLVVALDVDRRRDRASCGKRAPPNSNSNSPIVHERVEIGICPEIRDLPNRGESVPPRRSARLIRAACHVIHSILAQLDCLDSRWERARARCVSEIPQAISSRELTARSARTSVIGRGARWSEGGANHRGNPEESQRCSMR